MFMPSETPDKAERVSQTLLRALDILDAARGGPIALTELERRLGLTRSTAHRLASALVDRRLLTHDARKGYRLGPKLMDLGWAREATQAWPPSPSRSSTDSARPCGGRHEPGRAGR
ncbi:helix-turn-helix domain-containing protein [Caulobacter segnis]